MNEMNTETDTIEHHIAKEMIHITRDTNTRTTHSSSPKIPKDTPMAFRMLIIDTETTGLPKKRNAPITDSSLWPHIVQVGCIVYKCPHKGFPGRILSTHNWIIRPDGWEIPVEASNIHHITQEIAEEKGVPLMGVLQEIEKMSKDAHAICCHNVEFDVPMVLANAHRISLPIESFSKLPTLCTMTIGKPICGEYMECKGSNGTFRKYKSPKLSELYYKLFNTYFVGRFHDALEDCKATSEILEKLITSYLPFVRVACPDLFH